MRRRSPIDFEPEIFHLPRKQQQELMRRSRQRMLHDRRYVLGAVLRALPTFAPAVVLIMRIERSWLFPVATLINMVSVWRLVAFSNRTRRLALQAELLAQGLVPQTCFHCGYDLRASHGCCSECGAVIQQ